MPRASAASPGRCCARSPGCRSGRSPRPSSAADPRASGTSSSPSRRASWATARPTTSSPPAPSCSSQRIPAASCRSHRHCGAAAPGWRWRTRSRFSTPPSAGSPPTTSSAPEPTVGARSSGGSLPTVSSEVSTVFKQVVDPVGGSLGLSALCAAIPLVTLFVLLGVLRVKAWIAGLVSLLVAIVVAIAAFAMPVTQTLLSAVEGAAFGFFPILWIVINAIWVYNLTVESGHFDLLRRSFERVSPDLRVQAIIIAFCFGALLEALAGFGTPVAITVVMLMTLGFTPLRSAALALIANTAPVAFGALATPIVTLSTVTSGAGDDPGLTTDNLGAMVGRQTPLLALVVPLILVLIVDGRRGLRNAWLPAVVCGLSFAVAQFVASNYVSVTLTDIIASLVAAGAVVLLVRVWQPAELLTADPSNLRQPVTVGGGGTSTAGRSSDPDDLTNPDHVDTRA